VTPLFADTFYWIALADFTDTAHPHALALTSERAASPIVTTDEVLTEYLTFFSTAPEQMRREVAASVQGILESTVDPRPATPEKRPPLQVTSFCFV
jgi:hypothetical protein